MDYLIFFSSLLSFLLLYKYAALFILIFVSSIGFPVPSNTLLIAVGAFASQNYFNLPLSLGIALFANISGDLSEYFLMRKYGRLILEKKYHKKFNFIVKFERHIKFLEKYINSHQRTTIFITRFLGVANAIVNFLAGLAPVKLKIFIVFDALGNFLCIAFMILLGFFISESWQSVAEIIGTTSTFLSAIILLILAIVIIKKFYKPVAR